MGVKNKLKKINIHSEMGCWAFFFFLRDTILDFAKSLLPLVKPKILKFLQKIRRCYKSHAAPFNLLIHNISTNLNGATESLAPYKWCYENQT
jgi:hypothetical protein